MAKFNEILVGRFNRALQKLFSIKGGPPSAQLATEITPNIQFNSMGQAFRAFEDWYRFGINGFVAGAAANSNQVRFRNPPSSNRIVIFEKIACATLGPASTAIDLETQTTNVDLTTVLAINSNVSWDKRKNVGSALVFSSSAVTTALSLIRQQAILVPAGGNYDFILSDNQEVILSPGEAIQLRQETLNQNLFTAWWWRERFFEESEATA